MEVIKKEELEEFIGRFSEDLAEEFYLEALENTNDDYNKMVIEDFTMNGVPYAFFEETIDDFEGRYAEVSLTIKRLTDNKLFSINIHKWGCSSDEWNLKSDFEEVVSKFIPLEDRLTIELDLETLKTIVYEWDCEKYDLVKETITDFDGEKCYVKKEIIYRVNEHDKYLMISFEDWGKGEIGCRDYTAIEVFKESVTIEDFV